MASPSLGCSEGEEKFLVWFSFGDTDNRQGIEWEVRGDGDHRVFLGGNSTGSDGVWMDQGCLPVNTCYNFTVVDGFGDGGLGALDEYVGFFGEKEVMRGGSFIGSEVRLFGSC